jgi:hypothetical protein
VEEVEEAVKQSEVLLSNTSGKVHDLASEKHLSILKEASKRAEWLRETRTSTDGHIDTRGVGIRREKTREPIDPKTDESML